MLSLIHIEMCIRDSTYIGSEHILLGLLSDTSTVAVAVLAAHNITYADIEEELKRSIGVGVPTELQPDDFTPRRCV